MRAAVRRVTRCWRKRSRALCTFHWWMPWERSLRTAAARSTFSARSMDSRDSASSSGIRTVMTFMKDARVTHVHRRSQPDPSDRPSLHARESFQVPRSVEPPLEVHRVEEPPVQPAERGLEELQGRLPVLERDDGGLDPAVELADDFVEFEELVVGGEAEQVAALVEDQTRLQLDEDG